MSTPLAAWLDAVARILFRCWVFGALLLFTWFGLFALAPDLIFRLHGSLFGLSLHELCIIHYSGMGLVKLVVLCGFFFPWAAIRLERRREGGQVSMGMPASDPTSSLATACPPPTAVLQERAGRP